MSISSPQQRNPEPRTDQRLQIDVWTDLPCPWCYIGKSRLDRAIASSPDADAISVRIHSYELDPDRSREPQPNSEFIAARYGPAQAEQMEDRIAAIAHGDGLPFTPDRLMANSFDVHRVLHLAAEFDVADRLLGDLQRTLFSGEADAYDHAVLADAATRVGIPRDRVEEVLATEEYGDAVRADEREARDLGITGVPFTVFDGRIAIPGATSVEGFAEAIEKARGDR